MVACKQESSAPPSTPSLAVVGAGALGSELCRLLINLRYPNVQVIDPESLAARNLPLSPLFRTALEHGAQLGQLKSTLITDYARRHNLPWQSHPVEIADLGLDQIQPVDFIFSCTDSTLARLETAYAARTLGLPMIDGGVQPDGLPEGRVSWFPPALTAACPLCGLTESRRAQLLAFAASSSLGCTLPPDFPPMTGAPVALAAVAQAMLQLLLDTRSHAPQHSFTQPILSARPHITLSLSTSCPWHQPPATLIAIHPDETFAQALTRFHQPTSVIELPWPICLRAQCRACRTTVSVLRRTAYTRRVAACPECASVSTLEPMQTLSQVQATDPAAAQTPRQLGLPEHQLFRLRAPFFASPEPESEPA